MARAEPSVRSPAKRIRRRARLALQVATRSRGVPPLARFLQWAEAALSRPAQFTLRIVGERGGRHPREAHYAHLPVHGLLHMQGFDHRNAGDARVMERLETRILRRLG